MFLHDNYLDTQIYDWSYKYSLFPPLSKGWLELSNECQVSPLVIGQYEVITEYESRTCPHSAIKIAPSSFIKNTPPKTAKKLDLKQQWSSSRPAWQNKDIGILNSLSS